MSNRLWSWRQVRLVVGLSIFIICSASNCFNHSSNTIRAFSKVDINVSPSPHLVINDSVNFRVSIDFPGLYLSKNLQMELDLLVEDNGAQQLLKNHIVQPPLSKGKMDYQINIDVATLLDLKLAQGYSEVFMKPRISNVKNGNYKEGEPIPITRIYTDTDLFREHQNQ